MNPLDEPGDGNGGTTGRAAIHDAGCLARLRREVLDGVGLEYGAGVLYGIGFMEGLVDGARLIRSFRHGLQEAPPAAGPTLPMLFRPDPRAEAGIISGRLEGSIEARIHLAQAGESADAVCFLSAGYASGWFSELVGKTILVRETRCEARGDASCSFVARALEEWEASPDPWIAELLPYLDFDYLRQRASEMSEEPAAVFDGDAGEFEEDFEPEGDMLGNFDPMSPAVHIWGPLMVLPYSGAPDGEACLDTVTADLGTDHVRIVVLDVTGARIGFVESAGLVTLLDRLESLGIETIITGLPPDQVSFFADREHHLSMPLLAGDISQGIALGFQICQGSAQTH